MSGESTRKTAHEGESLDRVFGEKATCNRCGTGWPTYRTIVSFFDDLVAIRAYCPMCYEVATEGEYHAAGSGLVLDSTHYARRFGAPAATATSTPVNRLLATLVRDPALRELVPGSEAAARRLGHAPHRFLVEMEIEEEPLDAVLVVEPSGKVVAVEGEPRVCERLRGLVAVAGT